MSLRNRKDASSPSVDPPAVERNLIESHISELEGNLEQNYLITELKQVKTGLIEWLNQIWNFWIKSSIICTEKVQERNTTSTAVCKTRWKLCLGLGQNFSKFCWRSCQNQLNYKLSLCNIWSSLYLEGSKAANEDPKFQRRTLKALQEAWKTIPEDYLNKWQEILLKRV